MLVLGVCKASVGTWAVEMMIVAIVCRLNTSAELP